MLCGQTESRVRTFSRQSMVADSLEKQTTRHPQGALVLNQKDGPLAGPEEAAELGRAEPHRGKRA